MTADETTRALGRGVLESGASGADTAILETQAGREGTLDGLDMAAAGIDSVTLSPRAAALIAAGRASGACIIDGIEHHRDSVEIDGVRRIVLDAGLYGLTYR